MAISKHTPALFNEGLPDPRLQQFRMRRLQVHNWGTFNGLTEVPIAERGFLFVGRSGSGKSTLLDAMSALLTPPAIVDFNAAAREAERSGRDRNLVSYVRGAWADQQDSGTGEIATQYLRKGATWTALVLEYRAGDGRVVSLVRLLWISGNGTSAGDVRKHYMIAERPFDIAKDLGGFDLDLRKLKQKLPDLHHFDTFSGYAERFRDLLGIDNEMALRLLHKTQSAKNLGDLNVFLRDFMLDTPKTFDAAERLVSDFAELDGAHQAVVTARRQVETLLPARAYYNDLKEMHRRRGDDEALKLGVDSFRESRRQALIEARLREMDVIAACLAKKPSAARRSTTTPNGWPNWNCSAASRAANASRNWNASRAVRKRSAIAARPSANRPARPPSSCRRNCPTTPMDLPNWSSARRTNCRIASVPPRHWTMRSAIAWVASAMTSAVSAKSVRNSKRCSARPPTSGTDAEAARAPGRKPASPSGAAVRRRADPGPLGRAGLAGCDRARAGRLRAVVAGR